MKKQIITLATVLVCASAFGTLTKVLSNVAVNGSTNTTAISAIVGSIPPQTIIVDTTGPQTNTIAVSLDGTNFLTVATNVVAGSGTTNFNPTIPTLTVYYRVGITTTNSTTNTVYFSY